MSLEEIINWNEVSEDKRIDLLERPTQVIRKDQNEIIEKIFAAVISQPLSKNSGAKTVYEKNLEDKSVNLLKEQKSELAKKIFSNFPDAKLIDVKEDKDA